MVLKEPHHQVHGPEMAPVSLLIFFLTICWVSCAPGDDGGEAGGEMGAHRFISTRVVLRRLSSYTHIYCTNARNSKANCIPTRKFHRQTMTRRQRLLRCSVQVCDVEYWTNDGCGLESLYATRFCAPGIR